MTPSPFPPPSTITPLSLGRKLHEVPPETSPVTEALLWSRAHDHQLKDYSCTVNNLLMGKRCWRDGFHNLQSFRTIEQASFDHCMNLLDWMFWFCRRFWSVLMYDRNGTEHLNGFSKLSTSYVSWGKAGSAVLSTLLRHLTSGPTP